MTTATPEQAEAARVLHRITALAGEHGTALTRCFRLLGEGALAGPAANALHARLADAQREIRSAFSRAFDEADALARQAVPAPAVPRPAVPYPPPASPAPPGVGSAIPSALSALTTELSRAGGSLEAASRALSSWLSALRLPVSPARRLSEAAAGVRAERADLTRRLELLTRPDPDPAATLGRLLSAGLMMTALRTTDPALYRRLTTAGVDPADIPRTGPADTALWWKHLTRTQRTLFTTAFPALIGWSDGLPAAARDKANRLTLTTRLKTLEQTPTPTPFEPATWPA
ncbi:hypothetical protein [Actinocorallia longicatena]|uniref:Uncharacterized protein n=1 Tax=Actinocorallia longicatena TaxID=111803 RepID=A0ABP6QJ63_9ACTN